MVASCWLYWPCRHTKHRQDKVLQELTSSAVPPAPIDIEELNKVGQHAEVRWGHGVTRS